MTPFYFQASHPSQGRASFVGRDRHLVSLYLEAPPSLPSLVTFDLQAVTFRDLPYGLPACWYRPQVHQALQAWLQEFP